MHAAYHKRTDQKRGHPPERPEEEWIFFGIVVRGMCQIAGEPARGAGVALLARVQQVLLDLEPLLRVIDALDLLGALGIAKLDIRTVKGN